MLGNRLDSSSLNIKRHTLSSGFLHLESVSREHESALTISIYHTVTSQTGERANTNTRAANNAPAEDDKIQE